MISYDRSRRDREYRHRTAGGLRATPDPACGWTTAIPVLAAIGVAASLVYISQVPASSRWIIFGTALTVAGASSFVGGIVGFLFGIPRSAQSADRTIDAARYHGNTNLEQVSDWLTKIILGVGLVQLDRLLPSLGRLAQGLKVPLGGQPSSGTFGLALACAYTLLGFLFMYLWSRERLPRQLHIAETIDRELGVQEGARQEALLLINRQLDSLKGGTVPTQEELDRAIAAAPGSVRLLLFNEAERVRSANWQDPHRKHQMELSIPVFRALIAADTTARFHRIHGSLGWALKDQRTPDWQAAYAELSQAIDIRDERNLPGWKTYEAARAICAIHLLEGPATGQLRQRQLRENICHDLSLAKNDPYAARIICENDDIQRWMAQGRSAGKECRAQARYRANAHGVRSVI